MPVLSGAPSAYVGLLFSTAALCKGDNLEKCHLHWLIIMSKTLTAYVCLWDRKLLEKNASKPGQMCITFLTWAFPFVRYCVFHSSVLDELECAKERTLSIFSRPICIFPCKKTACYFMSHLCDLCLGLHCAARVLIISTWKERQTTSEMSELVF